MYYILKSHIMLVLYLHDFELQKLGAEVDVSTLEDRIFVLKTQDNAVSTTDYYHDIYIRWI